MANASYNVSAYRDRSPMARAVMSKVAPNDKFEETVHCTARVHVENAFYDEKYQGPGSMHRPYIKILGNVSEIFLEDGSVFPTGTQSIRLIESQPTEYDLEMTDADIIEFTKLGGFRTGCIKPPPNLVANVIELPMDIQYMGVYESPICIIGVPKAYELTSSTYESGYITLVQGSVPHIDMQQAAAHGISIEALPREPVYGADMQNVQTYMFGTEEEEVFDDQQTDMSIMDEVAASLEEDAAVPAKFADLVARNVNRVKTDKDFDAAAVVRAVKEKNSQEQEAAIRRAELSGDPDKIAEASKKMSESEFYKNIVGAAGELSEAEKQKKEADDRARAVDVKADLEAMAAGNYDTAGMGSSGENVTQAEKDRKEQEKRTIAFDNASDNINFNEGRSDLVAGGVDTSADKPTRRVPDFALGLLHGDENKEKDAGDSEYL